MAKTKIKLENRVAELSSRTEGGRVSFPKYDGGFTRFKSDLKVLLVANFGITSVGDGLTYDDEKQEFWWADQIVIGFVGKIAIDARRVCRLDPKKPLVEEFRRLTDEREEAISLGHSAYKALRDLGITS